MVQLLLPYQQHPLPVGQKNKIRGVAFGAALMSFFRTELYTQINGMRLTQLLYTTFPLLHFWNTLLAPFIWFLIIPFKYFLYRKSPLCRHERTHSLFHEFVSFLDEKHFKNALSQVSHLEITSKKEINK